VPKPGVEENGTDYFQIAGIEGMNDGKAVEKRL
jgi:hypothetical protein